MDNMRRPYGHHIFVYNRAEQGRKVVKYVQIEKYL